MTKLHNKELYGLHSSAKIIQVSKSEKNEMGGACGTYGGEEGCIEYFGGNPRERGTFEDPVVDGRIILRWSCKKWDVGAWIGSIWLRIRTDGEHLWTR